MLVLVEQSDARGSHVTGNNIDHLPDDSSIEGREEDDTPEGVQQDEAKGAGGRDHQKILGATVQPHCSWTCGVGQHVDEGKCTTHYSKSKA